MNLKELTIMVEKYKKHRENPVLWDKLSPHILESELKGIVGFNIKVEKFRQPYKLGQKRNEMDYLNINDLLQNKVKYKFKTNRRIDGKEI